MEAAVPQIAPCHAQTPHLCAALPPYGSQQELLKESSKLSFVPSLCRPALLQGKSLVAMQQPRSAHAMHCRQLCVVGPLHGSLKSTLKELWAPMNVFLCIGTAAL